MDTKYKGFTVSHIHTTKHNNWVSICSISSIRHLSANQQIVCCVPGVKSSRGVNLNVEICKRIERITSTSPGVKMSRRA